MKIKVTYAPEQEQAARAALDALRRMFPTARVHESDGYTPVKAVFLTVTNPEKAHQIKQDH